MVKNDWSGEREYPRLQERDGGQAHEDLQAGLQVH